MTKADLCEYIRSKSSDLTKQQIADIIEEAIGLIKQTLATGESVKISGFGNFSVREKSSRRGRNPRTGEQMMLSARRVVTFKPSQMVRDAMNGSSR